MFALSTESTWPRRDGDAGDAEGQLGDPLDLLDRVDAGVVRDAVAAAAVAEVDAAGQLAHDHQVGARDALLAQRAGAGQRRARPAPAAGSRTARGPCAGRAGPARAAARRGRSCPTSARPPRRAAPRRRARQRSSTSGSSGVPCSSIEMPPTGSSLDLEAGVEAAARARPAAGAPRPTTSGPMPSPGRRDDLARRGGYGPPDGRLLPGPARPGRRGRSGR